MANTLVAYALWLTLGWFGAHHLYLRRPHHALLWFITLGGVCGLGWLRDIVRIPEYVNRANCSRRHTAHLLYEMGRSPSPSCGMLRCLGMVIAGLLGGTVLCGLVPRASPEDSVLWYEGCNIACMVLNMAGSALGVYLVANIGELQCSLAHPAAGAFLALPWLWSVNPNNGMPVYMAFFITWWQGLRWRPLPQPNTSPSMKTCLKFYFKGVVIWSAILTIGIFFNARVKTSNGEEVMVRDLLIEFLQSVDWAMLRDTLRDLLYYSVWGSSWEDAFERSHGTFTQSSSLKVLGLESWAGEREVAKRCRELSRKYHPDMYKTQWEKEKAHAKFLKVQEACRLAKAAVEGYR